MLSSNPLRPDFDRSSVALYIQLATLFKRRIEAGAWRTGQQIPTLEQLVAEFGLSRATVRQAIGVLEADGLLVRLRAKGTFVRNSPEQLLIEMTTDFEGLLNPRTNSVIEVLERTTDVSAPANLPPVGTAADRYVRLKRIHRHEAQAYLVTEVFIDTELADKLSDKALSTTTAMRLAISVPGVHIVDARQTLSIGTADIDVASLLELPLNAPVCYIDRMAIASTGRIVVISKGVYRGDVIKMGMKLKLPAARRAHP